MSAPCLRELWRPPHFILTQHIVGMFCVLCPCKTSAVTRAFGNTCMPLAGEVTSLLSFVSLNMRAIRKILKKLSKHVPPSSPMPGYVALEIDHPHEPGNRILSVRHSVRVSADAHTDVA